MGGITKLPEQYPEFVASMQHECSICHELREKHEFATDRCPDGDGEFLDASVFTDSTDLPKPNHGEVKCKD